jgi:hypothetical protein
VRGPGSHLPGEWPRRHPRLAAQDTFGPLVCQCDRDRVAKFDKLAVKLMFQVTHIVRFLLERRNERGLRFRNLQVASGVCGHDLLS